MFGRFVTGGGFLRDGRADRLRVGRGCRRFRTGSRVPGLSGRG